MLETLQHIDEQLLLWFNGYHTPLLDSTMLLISGKVTWVPLYLFLAFLLMKQCGWKRGLIYLVGVALVITFADQVCAHLIRPYVARLRPCSPDNPLSAFVITPGRTPRSYSFPSCHAANTFALATYLTLIFRTRLTLRLPKARIEMNFTPKGMMWFLFIWATVVSVSRLYLGVHHPGDVLVGAAIGSLIAWGIYALVTLHPYMRPTEATPAEEIDDSDDIAPAF